MVSLPRVKSQKIRINDNFIVGVVATTIICWYFRIYYQAGLITAYGDAKAKLLNARKVFDNLTGETSLAQMGGVWTSLHMVPFFPLINWDWAMWTGVAGAIPAMIWFIIMIVALYECGKTLWREPLGRKAHVVAAVGASVPLLSINHIYLSVTPMSESLFAMIITLIMLGMFKLQRNPHDLKWIFLTAVFLATSTQVRYECWFLAALAVPVFWVLLTRHGITGKERFGLIFVVFFLTGVVVFQWIRYEWMIFNNPLYFALGPYSASKIEREGGRTEAVGHILVALRLYFTAVEWNFPWTILASALGGVIVYLWRLSRRIESYVGMIYQIGLPPFFVVSLFLGMNAIDLSSAYNIRYGTTIAPLLGIGVCYVMGALLDQWEGDYPTFNYIAAATVAACVILSPIPSLIDPLGSPIVLRITQRPDPGVNELSAYLKVHCNDGGMILAETVNTMSTVQFDARIPLHKYVTEGSPEMFEKTLRDPDNTVSWIVLHPGDSVDQVIRSNPERFVSFDVVYKTAYGQVLHRMR